MEAFLHRMEVWTDTEASILPGLSNTRDTSNHNIQNMSCSSSSSTSSSSDGAEAYMWEGIKNAVHHRRDWQTDVRSCLESLMVSRERAPVSLYKHRISVVPTLPDNKYVVPRNGDIVVGLYLEDDADADGLDVMIRIGGVEVPPLLHLTPGTLTYLLEGTHCLPIIAILCSEVHVIAPRLDKVSVVYALISDEGRRRLSQSTNVLHMRGRDAVVRGQFGFVTDLAAYLKTEPDYNDSYVLCPNMVHTRLNGGAHERGDANLDLDGLTTGSGSPTAMAGAGSRSRF
jgi:hypothetical protein